jgi:hypothetical protein
MNEKIAEHREDLADLAESDLPAADLAEALLELSEPEANA